MQQKAKLPIVDVTSQICKKKPKYFVIAVNKTNENISLDYKQNNSIKYDITAVINKDVITQKSARTFAMK